jgi:protein TonB
MLAPSGGGGGEGSGAAAALARGSEGGVPAELGPYLERLRAEIQRSLAYPLAARRRGLAGTVHVEVELSPSGKVAAVVLLRSSSHRLLDEAAVETLKAIQPGPFPPEAPRRPLRVRLPIVFDLK